MIGSNGPIEWTDGSIAVNDCTRSARVHHRDRTRLVRSTPARPLPLARLTVRNLRAKKFLGAFDE
ncbi:hypothetical protein C9419_22925 [Paraburkholderia fungorum]|nr:MAG: hypothetical protein DI523_01020 [Paraburkholderia fungorum]QLD51838.1 hypothetical protein C9419_22925 [Paraburkholderia fungorum]